MYWRQLKTREDIIELFQNNIDKNDLYILATMKIVDDIEDYITYMSSESNFINTLFKSLVVMHAERQYLPRGNNFFFKNYLFDKIVFRATIKSQYVNYIKKCVNRDGLHIRHIDVQLFDFSYM